MSNVLYPLSMIEKLRVEKFETSVSDAFESGATATRLIWPAQFFKRRFSLQHSPLVETEWRYLRSFYSQRSGRYDSFWFRDNVHRGGNASVRFTEQLPLEYAGGAHTIGVTLEEVAAIRALPEFDELTAAAGGAPLFWWDPNRAVYYSHIGTVHSEAFLYDVMLSHDAPMPAGSLPLANGLAQYQHYAFTGAEWAKTLANPALAAGQPAATIFLIAKHPTTAAKQVLAAIGAMGSGAGLGLAIAADNYYEPWIGGNETWTNARQSNGTPNTWRSLAVVWAASSNTGTLYVNAASIGADANTRSLTVGPAAIGAAGDGTLKTTGNVAHVMLFAAALTLAQVKAVHNLLGYQYGLSLVT